MSHRHCAAIFGGITSLLVCQLSHAWGSDGHHTIGAIAAKLIAGTRAETQVKAILGKASLADASEWADCAKAVDTTTFQFSTKAKIAASCSVFETQAGEQEMEDFVMRNSKCVLQPGDEPCSKGYHYTDVNIAQSTYKSGLVGTRTDDVVAAIAAAAQYLKSGTAPDPFDFKDPHEALLTLTHYVGDVHQPLHVGAVYLSSKGKRVDPDKSGFDRKTFTVGGNDLMVSRTTNLHAKWDDVPSSLAPGSVTGAWVAASRALPATSGPMQTWPTKWASDTLKQAQAAYLGISFGSLKKTKQQWPATLPTGYTARMNKIKKTQLTAAGAHLAALLEAIWP